MSAVQNQILDRIRAVGRGRVFLPKDFLDLGSRDSADQALSRLAKLGAIQRLGRGLYLYPSRGIAVVVGTSLIRTKSRQRWDARQVARWFLRVQWLQIALV